MFPALYAILDLSLVTEPIKFADALGNAGVQLIQLRDKCGTARRIHQDAKELRALSSLQSARLIVNDRPDIAILAGAAGVHVGQEDLPVEEVRKIVGAECWVGVSTHNMEQLREANSTSADYIAVGPIFATASKSNPDPVLGIKFLSAARELTRKPLVAIGGITIESAADAFRAGADSVAVIRDLVRAADPAVRAREYLNIARSILPGRT